MRAMGSLLARWGKATGFQGRDKRSARRVRTRLRPQRVLSMRNAIIADCAMVDRSDSGAKLQFIVDVDLPRIFLLQDLAEGTTHEVELIWSRPGQAGVRFTHHPAPCGTSSANR
ncbi:MAG: hypothetical protein ABJD38_14630 [Aurantimonas coralicida]